MKHKRAYILATAILSLTLNSGASYATNVYKWTDERGVVHYGDKRPDGTKSETLRVESRASTPRPPLKEQLDKFEEEQKKENSTKQALKAEKEAQQQDQLRCSQAKNNLQTIENNSRIRIEDNGELRYMTPEEITAKKQEMSKIIEEACE